MRAKFGILKQNSGKIQQKIGFGKKKIIWKSLNMKWKYDDLQCRACRNETETQQHVYDCEDLKEINDEIKPIYENVLNGSVKQSYLKY